jgi:hypothetical protein
MRKPCTFRQRDVEAAIRAVKSQGYRVARLRITRDGTIDVDVGNPSRTADGLAPEGAAKAKAGK